MAVELQRTRELFPCEFQFPEDENDVVSALGLDSFEALGSDQSEIASSDTESSDCFAELTRDMNIQDGTTKESWDFSAWPCTTGIWSPFGSSYGSVEEGSSQEETPPTTPEIEKRHSVWDNSFLKGGDTNMITENMGKIDIKAKDDNVEVPNCPQISHARFGQNRTTTTIDQQIRAVQFIKLKQALLQKQQKLGSNKANKHDHHHIHDQLLEKREKNHVPFDKKLERARQPRKSANNHQHPHVAGSGMRAVFLDGSGSRNGPSCGTGVFLPCVIGETSRSHKKKGCPPVLIPAKVMQALKYHFDRMDNLSRQNNNVDFPMQRGNNHNYTPKNSSQKKRQSRAAPPATNQNDIDLPQDWTY